MPDKAESCSWLSCSRMNVRIDSDQTSYVAEGPGLPGMLDVLPHPVRIGLRDVAGEPLGLGVPGEVGLHRTEIKSKRRWCRSALKPRPRRDPDRIPTQARREPAGL